MSRSGAPEPGHASELERHLGRGARSRERWSLTGQAEVAQDVPRNDRVGDQGDQSARRAAVLTSQGVDSEDPAHELRPGITAWVERVQGRWKIAGRGGRWWRRRGRGSRGGRKGGRDSRALRLDCGGRRRRHDHVAPGGCGCEYAVVGELVFAWVRDQGCEALDECERVEDEVGRTIAPGTTQGVDDLAIGRQPSADFGDGSPIHHPPSMREKGPLTTSLDTALYRG